jgi:hypothetical protein
MQRDSGAASVEIDKMKEQITRFFAKHNVARLISSAAAGSDLLLISEAIRRGAACDIILPFDADRFRVSSVIDRGFAWGRLYDTALSYKYSTVYEQPAVLDDPFIATNNAILAHLTSAQGSKAALAIWDKHPRSATDYTVNFIEQVRLSGIKLYEISTAAE